MFNRISHPPRPYTLKQQPHITAFCVDRGGLKFFLGCYSGELLAFNYANGQKCRPYGHPPTHSLFPLPVLCPWLLF